MIGAVNRTHQGWRGELSRWFALTPEERRFVGGILGLALLGLAARYWHLKRERPAPYELPTASAGETP